MEFWREVSEFPGYSVSSEGRIRNDKRRVNLAILVNQQGVAYVGFSRDGAQHNRKVSHVVANAFLEPQPSIYFAVIHLDGDKLNASASNLMWRPKWFARQYHKQFHTRSPNAPQIAVEDLSSREVYPDIWEVVVRFGVMFVDVFTNAWNVTHHGSENSSVYPTRQRFRLLD